MNRLFWKIFAAFWLGLVLFSAATFWFASDYLERSSASSGREMGRAHYQTHLETVQRIAAEEGEEGVKRWLKRLDFRDPVPYYLVDPFGDDLLGRAVPEILLFRLAREQRRPDLRNDFKRGERRFPHQRRPLPRGEVEIPGQETYRLVADPRGITLARILKRPRVIALPLVIAAISSAVICLLLARYLVRPIHRLQDATRRVARGEFEIRVAEGLNGRRDEIGDLARDFDRMTVQLQQLIDSQRQLLSDVSHELRSPLARMQAALGLLQKRLIDLSAPDWPEAARQEALQRIEREAEKMNDLIAQILSLSRLDAKSAELRTEAIDLVELLEFIVADANFESERQRVTLLAAHSCLVQGNRELLSSAVENVIRNALKYSPESEAVEVGLREHDGCYEISVCDHGPGVPEEQLETIFEAFTRLDEARQSELGGHGIGLALAKKVMQKHEGSIFARNRPSGGLCVSLRLPA